MPEVPIAEAVTRLGVSESTLRRRIRKGELKARQVETPQGFVYLVEVPDGASPESPRDGEDGEGLRELLEAKDALIAAKDEEIAVLKEELGRRANETHELHVLLQQQQKALPPPARGWLSGAWHRLFG